MCNSIGCQIGKIAKSKWPSEWTGYTNQDEKEWDHIKWKLKRKFKKKPDETWWNSAKFSFNKNGYFSNTYEFDTVHG